MCGGALFIVWKRERLLDATCRGAVVIYEGFVEEGVELTRKMWTLFVEEVKSPWSQPNVTRRMFAALAPRLIFRARRRRILVESVGR